jgi:hypothetical protein
LNAAADGWTASVPLAFALAFALDLGLPAIAFLPKKPAASDFLADDGLGIADNPILWCCESMQRRDYRRFTTTFPE